jgi:hypothetical protein
MRDLPDGPALLALARDVLINDLLPLVPPERRVDVRLVANCMAIAEREATARKPVVAVVRDLEALYGPGDQEGLRRFASELRIGGFENSLHREVLARAILWRLTIARLRSANPRFLAANGFS